MEIWYQDPQVTTPVLKLFAELVQNRSQRLQFDVSSPNGILLFREASKIICTYGKFYCISKLKSIFLGPHCVVGFFIPVYSMLILVQ